MKKVIMALLATLFVSTSAMAEDRYIGQITYIQVRDDGQIAVKVLPNGATDEIYGVISNSDPEKMKAAYAMVLTALSTGKDVEAWKDGYWTTFFLRK
jgi:hypothetical protein